MLRILSVQNGTDSAIEMEGIAVSTLRLLLRLQLGTICHSEVGRHYDVCSINQTLQSAWSPRTLNILIHLSVNRTFFDFYKVKFPFFI